MGLNNTINENMLYNKNNDKNNLTILKMLKLDINDNSIKYYKYLNIKTHKHFFIYVFCRIDAYKRKRSWEKCEIQNILGKPIMF